MDNDNEQKANSFILIHCCHISSTSGRCLKLITRQWICYLTSLLEKYLKCIQVALFLDSYLQLILCLIIKGTDLPIQDPVGRPDGSCAAGMVSWARTDESECWIGENGGTFREERINYLG